MSGEIALVMRAAQAAAAAHAGQYRKGTERRPYLNHLIEVATLVAEDGGSAVEVAAALLHDAVEDTDLTSADIEAAFGADVAHLVDGLTDDPDWKALPRLQRKSAQAARLPAKAAPVRRIKIADQTSNLRDIAREPGAWVAADALAYIEGAIGVVQACGPVSPRLTAEFDGAAAEAMQKFGGKG